MATAATRWAGTAIQRIVDRAFADADDFQGAVTALARTIAALFPSGGPIQACPVAIVLQASAQEPELHDTARQVVSD